MPQKDSAPYANKGASNFFGMIANIDENMGRLDPFLRDTGLRKNTVVIFLADNGGTGGVKIYNARLRRAKASYHAGGHRVPCFVPWPVGGLRASADVLALTQVQGFFPKRLDFRGVKKTAGPDCDGMNLAPWLRGKTDTLPDRTRDVQYAPGFGKANTTGAEKFDCAVMRNQWRLLHGTKLYDMNADRAQQHDLAGANPKLVANLRLSYEASWKSVAPRLDDFVPSSDWQGAYADNANHIREAAGGPHATPRLVSGCERARPRRLFLPEPDGWKSKRSELNFIYNYETLST